MGDSGTELQQLVDALQYEDQIRYWESQLEAISNVRADIVQAQETRTNRRCFEMGRDR